MQIYIASSWKNEHGVSMLTDLLRARGHRVVSWIENNYGENHNHVTKKMDFETWVRSDESNQSFAFDAAGARFCDMLIYYAPAGKDAAAECGMAYGENRLMWGLYAKGEDFGLMRKMFDRWFSTVPELLKALDNLTVHKKYEYAK